MDAIYYKNRKTGQFVKEEIFGEKKLTWLYEWGFFSNIVRFFLTRFSFLAKLYALFQKSRWSKKSILPFIERFRIDTAEFKKRPIEFTSFNDFFIRELKEGIRPMDNSPSIIVSPAEGRVRVLVGKEPLYDIKGEAMNLSLLLEDEALAKEYEESLSYVQRLAPMDYHRIHAPLDGKLKKIHSMGERFYSVNPIALRKKLSYLYKNKRVVLEFDRYLLCLVGATFIGSIHLKVKEGMQVKKGEEVGHFSFGGSMCILIMKEKEAVINLDLVEAESEVLVQVFEQIGHIPLS